MTKTWCAVAALVTGLAACCVEETPVAEAPNSPVWGTWRFDVPAGDCGIGGPVEICVAWIDGEPYAEWAGRDAELVSMDANVLSAGVILVDGGDTLTISLQPLFNPAPYAAGTWAADECSIPVGVHAEFVPSEDAASGCN